MMNILAHNALIFNYLNKILRGPNFQKMAF